MGSEHTERMLMRNQSRLYRHVFTTDREVLTGKFQLHLFDYFMNNEMLNAPSRETFPLRRTPSRPASSFRLLEMSGLERDEGNVTPVI